MRSMTKFLTTLACLSVLGCAEGSPSQPPVIIEPLEEAPPPTCGNSTVDVMAGEQCDCGPMVRTQCQVQNMDCMAVNRGAGVLLCNAAPACTFNFSMCAISVPAPSGGTGAATTGVSGAGASGASGANAGRNGR